MLKQHNLEYHKNIKYMRAFTIFITVIWLPVICCGIYVVIKGEDNILSKEWEITNIFTKANYNIIKPYVWYNYSFEILLFPITFLILFLVFVKYKPDDDIL